MHPIQCRMARVGLKWSQADLAKKAGLKTVTVQRFESGKVNSNMKTVNSIAAALKSSGRIQFVDPSFWQMPPNQTDTPPQYGVLCTLEE